MRRSTLSATLLTVTLLLASCSDSGGAGPGGLATLPADPAGVLLNQDPNGLAHLALQNMTPSAVPPGDVVGGLMTIRLEAQVASTATVGEVNTALTDHAAAIVSMRTGLPFVTLVIPAVADVAEATTLADSLVATGAFALATPCFAPGVAGGTTSVAPGGPPVPPDSTGAWDGLDDQGSGGMIFAATSHLTPLRMAAAKNAKGLSAASAGLLPVLVPDEYASLIPDSRIMAQQFKSGPGIDTLDELANNGFIACGLIGIDSIFTQFDAVHPSPVQDIELWSHQLGGLTWIERIGATADLMPATGNFVLHTGWNYDPFFSTRSKTWRIVDAVAWRYLAGPHAARFVHVAAAGDWGQLSDEAAEAIWQSPFAVSDSFDFLDNEVPADDMDAYNDTLLAIGVEPAKLDNLRIAGSSNATDHQPSSFSSLGSDLRVIGENITAPCVDPGYGCDGTTVVESATATASAQVAGIFSYLWSLAPTRSADELLETVDRAWFNGNTPGLVDAYYATLALDPSIVDARVREELLDVAAFSDAFDATGNGLFDHHDLKVFMDGFAAGFDLRYDLNGDGVVGGQSTAVFDLDVNSPPSINTVSLAVEGQMHDYDESALTDLEILCYYGYSALYDGSTFARTILLSPCNGVPQAGIFVIDTSRIAKAYSGGSSGPEELMESLDTSPFVGTASSNATQTEATSVGLSSSSTTHNSQYGFDAYGNLTSLTAGGAGAADFSLTNAGNWTLTGPDGGSVSRTALRFQVVGGDVNFKLEVNADGSWTGDESIGEYGYVKVNIHLTDNNGNDYTDYDFETPEGTLPTFKAFNGVLPGDVFGGEFLLTIRVFTHASYNFETSTPPPLLSATASSSWDIEFELTP